MTTNPLHPCRVAVIDDDAMFRQLLVGELNARGYPATAIREPAHAEEEIRTWGAHVVLCDIYMPEGSGLDVARRLKAHEPATQVIVMTGFPDQETIDEAYELGADGYLIKPFKSIEEVVTAIEKAQLNIHTWHSKVKDDIQAKYPEEYRVIYELPNTMPESKRIDEWIGEVGS